MPTITAVSGTTTPTLILASSIVGSQEARTIEHELLDGPSAYTLLPAGPRKFALELLYPSEADAEAARTMHTLPQSFTISYPERLMLHGLQYVRFGEMKIALDPDTRRRFVLTLNISEVS
ncbi:hypothetical protein M2152_001993 [Microbacteriaceae bacterium SG_E_30_P1]|uniref:Uncharacterized protein n=1 Tax=Antiquaquibacter oligotrophicus TaxID=2880260 RepID=A0ABT6KPT2_9MICO|nr:hypothetical protein [Antiquaquibacter oligotrophicus]MDH6181811.1 hypothetical protein [Antiquaquibacter oligotrophicus]UDF12510.1 hypothetical protein LH407_10140 [Antiquaquibacter oligotrophicus]